MPQKISVQENSAQNMAEYDGAIDERLTVSMWWDSSFYFVSASRQAMAICRQW